jgi:hypothetical protein
MGIKIERQAVQLGGQKRKINRVKQGEMAPNFDSMFDSTGIDNPLPQTMVEGASITETGDAEISAALAAIKAEKKERRDAYRVLTNPNYYTVVVFQSTDQRDEFLDKAGWRPFGEKYIDGLALAQHLGVDVQPINLPRKSVKPAPKALQGHKFIEPTKKGGE